MEETPLATLIKFVYQAVLVRLYPSHLTRPYVCIQS